MSTITVSRKTLWLAGLVIVAVTIESTVEQADGTTTDRSTNQMVMVEQDGAWLMDGPPFDPRGK